MLVSLTKKISYSVNSTFFMHLRQAIVSPMLRSQSQKRKRHSQNWKSQSQKWKSFQLRLLYIILHSLSWGYCLYPPPMIFFLSLRSSPDVYDPLHIFLYEAGSQEIKLIMVQSSIYHPSHSNCHENQFHLHHPRSAWRINVAAMATTLTQLICFVRRALTRHGRVSPTPGELMRMSPFANCFFSCLSLFFSCYLFYVGV